MPTSVHALRLLGCACASAGVLWLTGCEKTVTPTEPQQAPAVVPLVVPPMVTPAPTETPALPPNAAQGDPIPKPTDGVRRPAQQADDKPMPGQNNDHSAPLTPSR